MIGVRTVGQGPQGGDGDAGTVRFHLLRPSRGSRKMIAVCQTPGVTLDELKAARRAMQQAY